MCRTKNTLKANRFVRISVINHLSKGTPNIYYRLPHDFLASVLGNIANLSKEFCILLWSFQTRIFLWQLLCICICILLWTVSSYSVQGVLFIMSHHYSYLTDCSMHLAWKPLLHSLNQFAHCIHPYWDTFCDSFYSFLRERIISHLAILILWTWLLQVDIFLLMWCLDKNARFQILLHRFDFLMFLWSWNSFLLQYNKNIN